MRYTRLRDRLRSARRDEGITQAQLASRSGVSRVTIARLESGSSQDVRAGTLESLCQALGLELTASRAGERARAETLVVRERERAHRLDLRLRHARLAARLLGLPGPEAKALVVQARANVRRWEREGLCSRHYVSRWRRVLDGSPRRVAERLMDLGKWEDAMLQNTPWTFAVGEDRRWLGG